MVWSFCGTPEMSRKGPKCLYRLRYNKMSLDDLRLIISLEYKIYNKITAQGSLKLNVWKRYLYWTKSVESSSEIWSTFLWIILWSLLRIFSLPTGTPLSTTKMIVLHFYMFFLSLRWQKNPTRFFGCVPKNVPI